MVVHAVCSHWLLQWVQQRFRQDFSQHFMTHFPFTMHNRLTGKGKTTASKVEASQVRKTVTKDTCQTLQSLTDACNMCLVGRLESCSLGVSVVISVQHTVVSLNLSVCEVMSYFIVDASGQMLPSPWFDQLATFVTGQLSAARLTTDQLLSLLRVVRRLAALPLGNGKSPYGL